MAGSPNDPASSVEGAAAEVARLQEELAAAQVELARLTEQRTALEDEDVRLRGLDEPSATAARTKIAKQLGELTEHRRAAKQSVETLSRTLEEAKARHLGASTGCAVPTGLILVIAAIVAVVAGFTLWPDDDSSDARDDGDAVTPAPGPRTTAAPADGSPGGDGEGGDVASFAGTWTLATGLDDVGLDMIDGPNPSVYDEVLESKSATIVIDESGAITGGTYVMVASAPDNRCAPPTYRVRNDFTAASGNVGPDGIGTVAWSGKITANTCVNTDRVTDVYENGTVRNFGIDGDTLTLCSSNMATTSTCSEPAPEVRATFTRS